jgi:PKD repeat protein
MIGAIAAVRTTAAPNGTTQLTRQGPPNLLLRQPQVRRFCCTAPGAWRGEGGFMTGWRVAGLVVGLLVGGAGSVWAQESPTGRTPKIFWTPERQAIWNQMRQQNHPWWQEVKANADLSGTSSARYADIGQWATIAYQVTGDGAYAQKAWLEAKGKLKGTSVPDSSRNFTREHFIDYAWMYDWLYPGLTDTQRQQWVDSVNYWADLCLGQGGVSWGTRLGDSDETTGHYFGLVLWDLASSGSNPRAGTFIPHSKVGGLDQTGTSRNNMRNAVADYVRRAEGGVWLESSKYNLGTVQLLLMGADGVKTAVGTEKFPEMEAFRKQAALAQIHEVAPDLRGVFQWGDNEQPRSLNRDLRVSLVTVLAGLLQGDPTIGPYVQDFRDDIQASEDMWSRWMVFGNPYAPRADFRGPVGNGHAAPGMGMLFMRDGWSSSHSLFASHMPSRPKVDHSVGYLHNFMLYRKGEYVFTHVIGYDAVEGEHHNAILAAGLSGMLESRGPLAQELAPDGLYAYHLGSTGGNRNDKDYYNPPPRFLHEWTRSTLYLPSTDAQHDTIVIFDRVNAEDPKTLAKLDRYTSSDLARINGAPALKQWILHTPVSPDLSAEAIAWQTSGGQQVRVSTLLPADQTRQVYDESSMGLKGTISASERKFQVRVRPSVDRRWDTFLNVLQVSNGAALGNSLVASTNGAAQGVLVRRPQHDDVLAMFNATQGPDLPATKTSGGYLVVDTTLAERLNANRLLRSGFTVTWGAQAARTQLLLCDLDPGTQWMAAVDGAAESAVPVSAAGLGRLAVAGTGSHTVILRAAGEATDTVAPVITNVAAGSVTDAGALITWTTNEPASSQVEYGAGTLTSQTALDGSLATVHATALTGLAADTDYVFRVRSADAAGNLAVSATGTFRTAAGAGEPPAEEPPPTDNGALITNVAASSGKAYETGLFVEGVRRFIDRTATFTGLPAAYVGGAFIRTANDDKWLTSASHLTFTLTASAHVCVLFDDRVTRLPGWLGDGSWAGTGETFAGRVVYCKDLPAGGVTLGGNNASPMEGAEAHYSVVAIAAPSPDPDPVVNQPPVLSPIGPQTVVEGETLSGTITADDPDGDALTFTLEGLPAGASFVDQVFTWTPAVGQAGAYVLTATVSDGALEDAEDVTVTVTAAPVNQPPVLSAVGAQQIAEGATLGIGLSASDPEGDSLTYRAVSTLPSGAVLSGSLLTWTPTYHQAGQYDVTVEVSDGRLADEETFTIAVANTNAEPVISAGADATGQLASPVTIALAGLMSDDGLPDGTLGAQWSVVSGPGAVTFGDPTQAQTTATFTVDGTYVLRLTVSDGEATVSDEMTVTILPTPEPDPTPAGPVISGANVSSGRSVEVAALESGAKVYMDRTYTVGAFPASLAGQEFIRMRNEDKYRKDSTYLTFTLLQPAAVYVAFDPNANALPSWLQSGGWVKTGETLTVVGDGTRDLYRREYPAGTVKLGGNGALWKKDAYSQYTVIAAPTGGVQAQ